MASRIYISLRNRIRFLANNLLPSEKENGDYNEVELDLIKSFVLLCSAEFEEYLESRLIHLNQKSQSKIRQGKIPNSAAGAIAHSDISRENINKKTALTFSMECFQQANKAISKNHGYKQSKIEKLFKSHGFDEIGSYSTLLSSLDQYGKVRGVIAHNGARRMSAVLDPVIMRSSVEQILIELEGLDKALTLHARNI